MTWLSFVVAVFPSSPLLVLLLLLSLLASLVSSGLTSDCLRWNCPCTGDTLRSDGKITIAKRFQLLSRKAQHTRQKAQFLLNRVVSTKTFTLHICQCPISNEIVLIWTNRPAPLKCKLVNIDETISEIITLFSLSIRRFTQSYAIED